MKKLQRSFFKFLFKKKITWLNSEVQNAKTKLDSILIIENESYLNITFEYEREQLREYYSDLTSAFTTLISSDKIWDVTTTQRNLDTKAAAQTSLVRNKVSFIFGGIDIIKTDEKVFHLENYNGGDFYFYPNFILYFKSKEEIAVLDYSELYLNYSDSRFLEEQKDIPSDAQIVGETWYRVNKDGSADKRFSDNYKIPIVLYGSIHFRSQEGINELFYFSDNQKAQHFSSHYLKFQSLFRTRILR